MHAVLLAIESAIQDVRYGARLLRRSPWFTLVGVVSLAVGLGSGVALFTVMNALLFRPLPGRDTAGIHSIHTSNRDGGRYGGTSFADFQSFTAAAELFASACATTNVRGNIAVDAMPQALSGAIVSGGCFDTLRVRPHIGRLLNQLDDSPGAAAPAIVISHALWRRAFAGDPDIVGRATFVNGRPATFVGVAEPGFAGTSLDGGAEFWASSQLAPVLLSPNTLTARGDRRFRVYVRLKDGVALAQVDARLALAAAQLRAEDPRAWTESSGSTRTVTVSRELDSRFPTSGAAAAIGTATLAAISAIVAIACVNLATIIMARGAARTHELNVRLALGASRRRLLRQLATESLLFSIGGVAVGIAIVAAGLVSFDAYRPAEIPAVNLALDWRVAGFSIAMAIAAPVLFGLAPGAHALRLAIAEGLKGRPALIRRRFLRAGARELLLVVQLVVSFALLIAAALFMRSLASAAPPRQMPAAARVAVVPVDLNTAGRTEQEARTASERLLQLANRVPDVEGATAAAVVPMTGSYVGFAVRTDAADATEFTCDGNIVAPGYLELAHVAVRAGRVIDERDHERAPRVTVVSESLARRLWNTTAAVGRTLWVNDAAREVVGVVADVPYRSLTDPAHPVMYLPLAQAPARRFVLHARVRNEGEAIAALDRALRAADPRIFIGGTTPLSHMLEQTRTGGRVAQWIGAVAGLLQLGLALMATWGLVAYAVERRTAEIAVRRALGATERSILQLVMRPTLYLLAIGAVLGCGAGVVTAQALHSTFLGLAPIDLAVVVPAAALSAIVVIVGAWLPARRATSIELASALKQT